MCEVTTATVLTAASLAATAASTAAAYQASQQQDSANATSIRDKADQEYRNSMEAAAKRRALNDEAAATQEALRRDKSALTEQELAQIDAQSDEERVNAEFQKLSERLTPQAMVATPESSSVGGYDDSVRVVQEAQNKSLQDSRQNYQLPMAQALAQIQARQNVSLGNQLSMGRLGDQFSTLQNAYGGNMSALGLGDQLNSSLFQLGQNNAANNFANAQSRLPYVGQDWRTASGIASGVGNLAGMGASYSAYGSGAAPKTNQIGEYQYATNTVPKATAYSRI